MKNFTFISKDKFRNLQNRFAAIILVLIIANSYTFAQCNLFVDNPHKWGTQQQGTIEEASLKVQPRGLYMEYELFLTFSARDCYFADDDQVEVQFYFELPLEAIVHDSWLWVEDEIVKADISDRWSASRIYESIVDRRKDPSILVKQGNGRYELRVYPMMGNGSRKVKISYLMPTTWTKNGVSAQLPLSLLRASNFLPEIFTIYTIPDNEWQSPKIPELREKSFFRLDYPFQDHYQFEIQQTELSKYLSISFDNPMKSGVYLNNFQDSDEGIYQLSLLPSEILNIESSNKIVILIDYDKSYGNLLTRSAMFEILKSFLLTTLSDKDSLNIILSDNEIIKASDSWISGTQESIEAAFSALPENVSDYQPKLLSLISEGMDFIKANNNEGNIILISNVVEGKQGVAIKTLTDNLWDAYPDLKPIHTIDYSFSYLWLEYWNQWKWQNYEQYYSNNFLKTLSRLTNGNFNVIHSQESFYSGISSAYEIIGSQINSFDLHTTMNNGFCYNRFNISNKQNISSLNRPIMQIGKFKGDFPFEIQLSGEINDEIFSKTIEILEDDIYQCDTLAEEIWTGCYIDEMESENQSNDVIQDIVEISVDERVLSKYTAFLALDPNLELITDPCPECKEIINEPGGWDEFGEDIAVTINDENIKIATDSIGISAYPNPFVISTKIEITIPSNINANDLIIKIYDTTGKVIKSFEADASGFDEKLSIIWNGVGMSGNEVPNGMYYLVVNAESSRQTIKLIKR